MPLGDFIVTYVGVPGSPTSPTAAEFEQAALITCDYLDQFFASQLTGPFLQLESFICNAVLFDPLGAADVRIQYEAAVVFTQDSDPDAIQAVQDDGSLDNLVELAFLEDQTLVDSLRNLVASPFQTTTDTTYTRVVTPLPLLAGEEQHGVDDDNLLYLWLFAIFVGCIAGSLWFMCYCFVTGYQPLAKADSEEESLAATIYLQEEELNDDWRSVFRTPASRGVRYNRLSRHHIRDADYSLI